MRKKTHNAQLVILFCVYDLNSFSLPTFKLYPMLHQNFRTLIFVPFLLTVLVITSCQREVSFTDIDTVTEYVKDSTLLIKSITFASATGQDSIVENYSYDSVNRRITITWTDATDSVFVNESGAELSYNDKWLLTRATYIYPLGYIPQAWDYTTIDIVYDAQKVLQKITVNYGDGSFESKVYTKAMLASGKYQLSWVERDPANPLFRRATFNADGRNITNVVEYSVVAETTPAGDDIFTNIIITDSMFYDAPGSIIKIIRNEVDTLRHTNQSYVSYDFSARQTRGDQLYNQRQAIMNGMANMPFFDSDSNTDLFGGLSASLENENWQYSKYPIQTAHVRWLGTDYNFNATSEFDSKGRLVKYKGFRVDLVLSADMEYRIKYYK
jgi:hypothetical protein